MKKSNEQTVVVLFSQSKNIWLKKTIKFYKTYKAAKAAIVCFKRHRIGTMPYPLQSNDCSLKGIKNKPQNSFGVVIYRKA